MSKLATAMSISALMVLCMLVPCINGIDADIEVEQVYVEDAPVIVYMEEDVPVVLDKIAAVTDRIEYGVLQCGNTWGLAQQFPHIRNGDERTDQPSGVTITAHSMEAET